MCSLGFLFLPAACCCTFLSWWTHSAGSLSQNKLLFLWVTLVIVSYHITRKVISIRHCPELKGNVRLCITSLGRYRNSKFTFYWEPIASAPWQTWNTVCQTIIRWGLSIELVLVVTWLVWWFVCAQPKEQHYLEVWPYWNVTVGVSFNTLILAVWKPVFTSSLQKKM